ncbi:MAG: hypothetical protein HUJ79_06350 [Firmicutes bacterium]|nr:hypothetical protein [Bacillota bacterium]
MLWPVAIVVFGNIGYHICAKETPEGVNAFASLTITYAVGAVTCFIVYLVSTKGGNILTEYAGVNWATFVLGVVIVFLEVGAIFLYRTGWNINTGNIVCNISLAACLFIVGLILYGESITVTKAAGFLVCAAGLVLINK